MNLSYQNKLVRNIGLKTFNAWKVSIRNEKFIITPAHNVIYSKNKSWSKSDFVPEPYNTDWYSSKKYIESEQYDLLYDLAWKPIPKNIQTIETTHIDLEEIYQVQYYTYQPYDFDGNKVKVKSNSYVMASGNTTIYNSPGTECFESIGIGYRGMSGAIVLGTNNTFVGLFIRKIKNLGTELKDSTLLTETIGTSRGFIMPVGWIEKIIYDSETTRIL